MTKQDWNEHVEEIRREARQEFSASRERMPKGLRLQALGLHPDYLPTPQEFPVGVRS
jgi:hypothetical protein